MKGSGSSRRGTRWSRGACLLLFLALLGGVPVWLPENLFLRLDPLVALAMPLAARAVIPALVGGLLMLVLAVWKGRFFCRHICPMGTTLSLGRSCLKPLLPVRSWRTGSIVSPRWRYLVLAGALGAAAAGVNAAFWVAPIPLITRFFALVLMPLGLAGSVTLAETLRLPGLDLADIGNLAVPVYAGALFTALFFAALLLAERVLPGLWCSSLCPAGAAQSLAALLGRRVRAALRRHATPAQSLQSLPDAPPPLPSRRAFAAATLAGVGFGLVHSVPVKALDIVRGPRDPRWLRPPASVPETAFLARCTRCDLCLHVCPNGALQGQGLEGGLVGLFSPVFVAARGGCDPGCTRCGEVCPTGAIANLPLDEKLQAKMGTASIKPSACIVWEDKASCLVCHEVCPFGAIELEAQGGGLFAPAVQTERCYGCGYCEHHCPAQKKAITVTANGALRLDGRTGGKYAEAARRAGLDLRLGHAPPPVPAASPGSGGDDLPPGFSL